MKRIGYRSLVFLAFASILIPASVTARDIAAIVSVDWLERNLSNPKLIVLDVRKVEEYRQGHIPGAINAFYGTWVTGNGYHTEVPREDDLFEAMGGIGIRDDSLVVIVGRMDVCQTQVECTRVLCTLHYGGFDNVAMLDGGYELWVREKNTRFGGDCEAEENRLQGSAPKRDAGRQGLRHESSWQSRFCRCQGAGIIFRQDKADL